MKKIKKIKLNVDYKEFKIDDIITFSEVKEEQKEAFELHNSGVGKIIEYA